MSEPRHLRLAAIDEEDLAVISAHVQDAVLKVGDLVYLPKERRFALGMNRFAWETAGEGGRANERHRAALTFDRVLKVSSTGIDLGRKETVLDLLAVNFEATDPPAGNVTLVFAGGGAVRLTVEVVEARLADLGAAWAAKARPAHDLQDSETKPGA